MIQLLAAGAENRENRFRGLHRDRALLHDDFGLISHVGDHPGDRLDETNIGGASGTHTKRLGGGVDTDENDIGATYRVMDAGGEEQIPAARRFDDVVQARLVDGKFVGIPGVNPLLVEIHDLHPNVGTLGGNHGHGRTADVACADAADLDCKIGC